MTKKSESWLRQKYRLAILEDVTLREVFHWRLSGMSAVSVLMALFIVLLLAFSLLIVYTPIRNILPGYSESIRQQLIVESARVDSLQTALAVQRQYLDVIKHLTAGNIKSDSVQRLDSMEIVQRAQVLELRTEATDAFLAQYEQRERDRLLLIENHSRVNRQLYRPVRGVVEQSAEPDKHRYGTLIRTAKNENVLSVMRGVIVLVDRAEDNTFTMVVQNNQYMSVYRHVSAVLKPQGTSVEAGESVGLMDGKSHLLLELWEAGAPLDPEDVIVF